MRPIRCLCSRCDIFHRAQNSDNPDEIVDYQDGSNAKAKSKDFEQREYQTALIKIATKRNIIACLPTGSGKTFIAYKLIEHFQHDIGSKGKKVFFLANTIPLVNQQAAFFARNLTLKVRHFTGDMEVDYWTKEKWEIIIDECQILAMTAQIFLNMLRHAQILLSQIALIIFDECHHAQNDHPMKQIMVEYHNVKRKHLDYALPRILGLTATIIMGNCKVHEVPARVRELESTMDSIAVTYKDYEEVMLHSTSAIVEPVRIQENFFDGDEIFLSELDKNGKELQALRKERKKLKAGLTKVSGIDPTLASSNNIYLCNKKPSPGDLRIAVDDVRRTYLDMGEYCAVIAINLRLAFIEFSLMDLTDAVIKAWYIKIRELFSNFKEKLIRKMSLYPEEQRVTQFITPKLRKLIQIVEAKFRISTTTECANGCESEENQLCGLIFTDRRVTAQVLAWYLKDLSATEEKYSFIRANFVVGTSRCPFETVESRIYAKKQTTTINAFRTRKFNLITATSVLEEGIDVPSCNLVVRFDPIKTYTSYVQSMGRARRKNALFYAFLDAEDYPKGVVNIQNFKAINEAMVAHLRAQVMKIDDEWNGHFQDTTEHSVEPFCPGGTADSPRVTMESAQEVVQNYCNLLPNDSVSNLQTLSWWTEHYVPTLHYQGHLKLPLNSVLKRTIDGEKMKSKELARQYVYLEAAKLLFENGALDDRLCPMRPTFPPKVDAFFNILDPYTATGDEKEVNGAVAACMEEGELTEGEMEMGKDGYLTGIFRKHWYRKKTPDIFQNSQLVVGQRYSVYRICMMLSEANEKNKWKELYKLEEANTSFGIITAEEIPEFGEFPLFGVFGRIAVRLEKIPNFSINLNEANFRTLKAFQQIVFRDILDLKNPLLTEENELCFVIIPLEKDNKSWKVYDNLFPRETRGQDPQPGINEIFTCERIKPPHEESRKRGSRFQSKDKDSYIRKYKDAVVFPWYKGKSRPLYVVDSVETEMTPNSRFHDGNFPTYKNFILTEYKKEVYNLEQPMLKCKLAGVGKGYKQLNYLLEKHTKEEEFPVYLIPELCIILNIPASILVQVKFLPSILHRLFRLLTARDILTSVGESCGWPGILSSHLNKNTLLGPDPDGQFTTRQTFDKDKEEERRQNRQEARKRLKRPHQPIKDVNRIENRELHYEFIHPNKITKKDIELFHQAVSGQHSAKKLSLPNNVESELANTELYEGSKIPLLDFDEVVLPQLDVILNCDMDSGPSVLSLLEGIAKVNSNEGISNERLKMIGLAFLNYAVSTQAYHQFPNWAEPVLCHIRNRLSSVQVLSTIAKKKNLGEILAGSGFYPDATWCPPGFHLIPHVGEIAAANSVHLGVYYDILRSVQRMTKEELESHVAANALRILEAQVRTDTSTPAAPRQKPQGLQQPFIKFATYTHSQINNWELADGVCALIGAFFTQSGVQGGLKMLEWLGFAMPDSDGIEHLLGTWSSNIPDIFETVTMEEAEAVIPNLSKLEELLGYEFKNRKYLLEALTHPTYFTSSISESYQRLQFLGDGILDVLLTNHVFTTHSKHSIQSLSEIKSALVNSITYASLAVRYDLHKYLLSMSKPLLDMIDNFVIHQEAAEHRVIGHFTLISDAECWGPKHIEVPKVLGDIFEALAGAIFLDSECSLDTVWKVYYRLMQNEIHDFFEEVPKSPLRELKAEFPEHGQIVFKNWTSQKLRARGREMFKITVAHLGHYYGSGTNKTRAKEAAAKIALKMCKDDESIIAKYDGATILMMI